MKNGDLILIGVLGLGISTAQSQTLFVRELWDDISGEQIPASTNTPIADNSSSLGFAATPWVANPAELRNCQLMAFRPGFPNEPVAGAAAMGLPCSLDGSYGCMVQENNRFDYFPNANLGSFWSAGDFLTRQLSPACYINFQAVGEYWFSMTIANQPWDGYERVAVFPIRNVSGFGMGRPGFRQRRDDQCQLFRNRGVWPQCLLRTDQCERPMGSNQRLQSPLYFPGHAGSAR